MSQSKTFDTVMRSQRYLIFHQIKTAYADRFKTRAKLMLEIYFMHDEPHNYPSKNRIHCNQCNVSYFIFLYKIPLLIFVLRHFYDCVFNFGIFLKSTG